MTDPLQKIVTNLLMSATSYPKDKISALIEIPRQGQGDRAFPCFSFAKVEKKSPKDLAEAWAKKIKAQKLPSEISDVVTTNGYINFHANMSIVATQIVEQIEKDPAHYGFVAKEEAPTMVLEFSSPNIAKPFSIGHLRTTNIGAILGRILKPVVGK